MIALVDISGPRRGASPAAALELLKPITWFAPMWAFGCGVVSSGISPGDKLGFFALGVLLAGPLVCGTSQAVNDWFDRHVDAINEPNRPIPSGRIPGRWGLWIAIAMSALSLVVAAQLGTWGLWATVAGLALAWAYSAPPIRLKRNGWWSSAVCGACYEGLPWITGAAVMIGGAPSPIVLVVAVLYSIGAHGIMTLNDFKAVEGDRALGIGSLPVKLGIERAARLACWVMALPQFLVVGLLLLRDAPLHACVIAALIALQLVLMSKLLRDPRKLAPWYNATGTTLYVIGMLVAALAIRPVVG
ncbi:chlorophyll synthase ChlG [Elioraea sp.]|uniref:chlorophyll synthase ChlG n=1 Tax=Elioraea sp. TaxID=2185103 RepID=UPI0025C618CA|nr:chlorophyll synthase ChlG [Elioraea sp.]